MVLLWESGNGVTTILNAHINNYLILIMKMILDILLMKKQFNRTQIKTYTLKFNQYNIKLEMEQLKKVIYYFKIRDILKIIKGINNIFTSINYICFVIIAIPLE